MMRRAVCRRHSVHHILSDDHRRGGPFNKARMIQRGFDQIGGQDWILHLDADIVLPRKFRQYLDWAHLDDGTIYGADRCNLTGWDEWQRLKQYAGPGITTPTNAATGSIRNSALARAGFPKFTAMCRSDFSSSSTGQP